MSGSISPGKIGRGDGPPKRTKGQPHRITVKKIVNMLPEGEVESVLWVGFRGSSRLPAENWPSVRYNISYENEQEKEQPP